MRKLVAALVVLLLTTVAFSAPRKSRTPVKVKRVYPRHTATYVPIAVRPMVTFTRPVDLATVTPATLEIRKLSGEAVPSTYESLSNGRIIALTPKVELESGTDYQIVIRAGIKPQRGRALRRDKHAYFFTSLDVTNRPMIRREQFTAVAGTMSQPRGGHTATRLPDGRVFLAGGMTDYSGYAQGGDLYDAVTDTFAPTGGTLVTPRANHVAARAGGDIILLGGANASGPLVATDLYDFTLSSFRQGPPLLEARDFTAAVALQDGRVLVTGGLSYVAGKPVYRQSAELLDLGATSFRFTPSPPLVPRAGHTLTLLPDGRVLVMGGESKAYSPAVEIFDPVSEGFQMVSNSPVFRRQSHSTTLLGDSGLILLADGGERTPQLYDPGNNAFITVPALSTIDRIGATASLLPDGNVLIVGGLATFGGASFLLDTMDLYVSKGAGSVIKPNVALPDPRFGHTATTLQDGRILFAGGFGSLSPASLSNAVLFTPDPPVSK